MFTRFVVVLLLVVSGCATLSREGFIHDRASSHRYDQSMGEVLDEVRLILEERGYAVRFAPSGSGLTTGWKEEQEKSSVAASYSRYVVEAFALSDKQCQVRIHRQSSPAGAGKPNDVDARSDGRAGQESVGLRADPHLSRVNGARGEGSTEAETEPASKRSGNLSVTRDLPLEWILMQRLSPDEAQELKQVAEAKYR